MGTDKATSKKRCNCQANGDFDRSTVSRGPSDLFRSDIVIDEWRIKMPNIKWVADSKEIVYMEIRRNQGIFLRLRMDNVQKSNEALAAVTWWIRHKLTNENLTEESRFNDTRHECHRDQCFDSREKIGNWRHRLVRLGICTIGSSSKRMRNEWRQAWRQLTPFT